MMKKVFDTGTEKILGLYSRNPGVVLAEMPGTEHLAHVNWVSSDSRWLNIDYFLVNEDFVPTKVVPVYNDTHWEVEEEHAVQYHIASRFKELEQVIRKVACLDIFQHAYGKTKPDIVLFPEESTVRFLEELNPLPIEKMLQVTRPAEIDVEGKQDFYPTCILDINIDFARWCMSGITPDGRLAPWNSCEYCYAAYKHAGYPEIYSVDREDIVAQLEEAKAKRAEEGKETRYLRLGKRTEAGADIFNKHVIETLQACTEADIRVVFPTKHLSFDKEIADLLRWTGSTLLFSIGNDAFEAGAVLHGKTNEWRLEQARKYFEAGVRSIPYILVDAVKENGGKHFEKVLKEAVDNFPRVQLLPVRLRYKEITTKILGSWKGVVEEPGQQDLFDNDPKGGYEVAQDQTRLHRIVHPSLEKLIGDNNGDVRMCSHNSETTWCGKCFMPDETGDITETQEVHIEPKRKRKWQ